MEQRIIDDTALQQKIPDPAVRISGTAKLYEKHTQSTPPKSGSRAALPDLRSPPGLNGRANHSQYSTNFPKDLNHLTVRSGGSARSNLRIPLATSDMDRAEFVGVLTGKP